MESLLDLRSELFNREEFSSSIVRELVSCLVLQISNTKARWGYNEKDQYPVESIVLSIKKIWEIEKKIPPVSLDFLDEHPESQAVIGQLERDDNLDNQHPIIDLLIWSIMDQELSKILRNIQGLMKRNHKNNKKYDKSISDLELWVNTIASFEDPFVHSDRPNPNRTFWRDVRSSLSYSILGQKKELEDFKNKKWPSKIIHDAYLGTNTTKVFRSLAIILMIQILKLTKLNNLLIQREIADLYSQFGVTIDLKIIKHRFKSDYYQLNSPVDIFYDLKKMEAFISLSPIYKDT